MYNVKYMQFSTPPTRTVCHVLMVICTKLSAKNKNNKTLYAHVFVFLVHDSNNQLQRIIIIKVVARSDHSLL